MSENLAKKYMYSIEIHNNDFDEKDTAHDIDPVLLVELLKKDIRVYKVTAILHDKDFDKEGLPRKPHLHIIVIYNKLCTKSVSINRLVNIINNSVLLLEKDYMFCNRQQVSVKAIHSPIGSYRYLLHKDNPEKHQYDFSEVLGDTDILERALVDNKKHIDLDIDELYETCLCSKNYTEVIFKIGMKAYLIYYKVIEVFMKEREVSLENYEEEYNHNDE